MMRMIAGVLSALALCAIVGTADAQAQKNQMVAGTIKSVDVKNNVLVVNQKVKNDTVERQLDIKNTTEFEITTENGEKKALSGNDGLAFIDGKVGASVKVKCDKDVNVLKVTVMLKK